MEVQEPLKPLKAEDGDIPLAPEPDTNGLVTTTDTSELVEQVHISPEDDGTAVDVDDGIVTEEGSEEVIKYDEDELLVKLVHSYRFLWNPLTKGYKDNEEKKRAWREISAALNKDGKGHDA
jgi:Alcohol dehydrogenase transcription factor Myb/SANT-like.